MSNKQPPFRLLEGTTQAVTVSGTSAATTNAFSADTTTIRVASTTNCHVTVGASPTATTSHLLILAGHPEYILVEPSKKLAAIQNAAGGTLTVTECSR